MTVIHGFRLQWEKEIEELKTTARLCHHQKTGAQLLSLSNDDENKVFGITFRTPPFDSTGLPHILEHSVLCGSKKYPVKEPFVELLKSSLQTFLNAFTYPDRTCYPVASQNVQDFYNLIDVYLDAVFYPRLTPFTLQQEGWHYELENRENPFIYKGVVFNEMKGAYSSPDNLLSSYSLQSLFPDNPYAFDAGGNPKEIPNLTFEQFQAFHAEYYHPSNARIYFYGDDDSDERLKITNEYLEAFDPIEINSTIRLQPPFPEPKHLRRYFMAGQEEGTEPKGMVTLNWLLPETTDVKTNFALHMLEYILLGMPASPLRKALIDSGLGEDLAGEGLSTELRQIYFSTGLKGVATDDVEKVEALVMETLSTLIRNGVDPLTVEAALNTIEFRLRENNTGSFPRGLLLMLRSLSTWLYDGDPLALLAFESPLKNIKSSVRNDSSFFEHTIERYFLKNPHRTILTLYPDSELRQREEAEERKRLKEARVKMTPAEIDSVIENTHTLKQLQETPDPPAALKAIPVLRLKDLVKKNKIIPASFSQINQTRNLFHDLFTNNIVYFDVGFNLHTLPAKYLPYIPLFGRALVEMGTEEEDFVSLTQRISRKTGGISPVSFTSSMVNAHRGAAWLFLRSKAMLAQSEELIHILRDILLKVRLDNQERFRQMVMEEKARQEQALIPAGHQFVNLRLRAHFDEAHWAAEQMGGISYLFFLRALARDVDEDWPKVLSALEDIRGTLVYRKAMVLNTTLDETSWARFNPQLDSLLEELPEGQDGETEWPSRDPAIFEGMTTPSQVNYVGKGADLYQLGYQYHGSAKVITRYLRNTWLWDRIRVQGGAYGAFCLFDRLSGVLTFVSYRDPNLTATVEVFDQAAQFLRDLTLSEEELTKGIIGAIGALDAHLLPDARGYASMLRYLTGDTEEARQQMRDEILETTPADFKSFSRILEAVRENGVIKVLGSPDAIESANTEREGWLEVVNVL